MMDCRRCRKRSAPRQLHKSTLLLRTSGSAKSNKPVDKCFALKRFRVFPGPAQHFLEFFDSPTPNDSLSVFLQLQLFLVDVQLGPYAPLGQLRAFLSSRINAFQFSIIPLGKRAFSAKILPVRPHRATRISFKLGVQWRVRQTVGCGLTVPT